MWMRARTPAVVAAAVAAALVAAGCGSAGGVRVGPPESGGAGAPSGCGDVVVDPCALPAPGQETCLGVGKTLRVRLAQGDPPPTAIGGALQEVSPGVYRGTQAGTARLSGTERVCPRPAPGAAGCAAVAGWAVTVDVR
jgi:hypothetical protein